MGFHYLAQDGDHLSRIARKFGFRSYRTVWEDPGNDGLRALRDDPGVLMPGDVVYIPDKQPRDEAADTGKRHVFYTIAPSLTLRIVVKDRFDAPLGGEPGDLDVDGDVRRVITAPDGLIERAIDRGAVAGRLSLAFAELPVLIGRLHPVGDPSGWMARLNNLGYGADVPGRATPDGIRSAVEEFQCDFGLPVVGVAADGTLDDATRSALLSAHGC